LTAVGVHPVVATWELGTPDPIMWRPPGTPYERPEVPFVVTPDFDLWQYRVRAGLQWADLTGQWPQPPWRTDLDRLYCRLVDNARTINDARTNPGG
jgi:hypothetical protein